jgi:hypothetical protein
MSISWGKGGRCVRLTTLPSFCAVVKKSGNRNFLEPSGSLQACNGTALPFTHWPEGYMGRRAGLVVHEKRQTVGPVSNRTTLPWLFIALPITIPTGLSRLHIHVAYSFIYLFIWVERRSV